MTTFVLRFGAAALALAVAACSGGPPPKPMVAAPLPPQPAPARGELIGLTAEALGQRFGAPDLQVREGEGLKLQYRAPGCVLDAYLYRPAGGGVARVVHVDTRDREGRDRESAGCIATLDAR
jgi:hypothetical protein